MWRWRSCCLTAPSHYLNQCWLIISKTLRHLSEDIIIRRFEDTNQYSKIENYIFKITTRSPRGQWVKYFPSQCPSCFIVSDHSLPADTTPWYINYLVADMRGLIQYRIRHRIIRSHKVSKAWDRVLNARIFLKFFQTSWQWNCREVWWISEQLNNSNTWSRAFETLYV